MSPVRWWLAALLVVVSVVALGPSARVGAQAGCGFVLGFASLRTLVGAATVGDCREDERFNVDNGNAEQRTTGGLLVWRKADNWTAFTDGYRTWINGPFGLARRLNTERFAWEADAGAPGTTILPSGPAAPPAAPAAISEPAGPVLAWYYPQFSQGWATDVASAQRAGIDALVVSQTTQRPGQPLFASGIGQAAHGTNLLLTLGIETSQVYPDQASLVRELQRILSDEAPHPRFLRYRGRPVLVFWGLPQVPRPAGQTAQRAWASIRDQVDPQRTSIWIAEGGDPAPATGTLSYLDAFDGLHLYSVAWDADPGRALSGWASRLRGHDPSKLWVATVMPGGYWGGADRAAWQLRDRQNGEYFASAWRGAIATQPNMVIVSSFNETAERTEIHPSPAWGDLYLDLNRQYGEQWRAAAGAPA